MLRAAVATAVVAAGVAVTPTISAATAAARPERDLLGTVGTTQWFSPNGDGVQDRLRVRIPVLERADVTVVVRRASTGAVVRRDRLGTLPGGAARLWRWNGRSDDGARVRDGGYAVTVRAAGTIGSRRVADRQVLPAEIRTVYTPTRIAEDRFTFELSRDTLHPATEDIVDKVFVAAVTHRFVRGLSGPKVNERLGAEWMVRDADGDLVHRSPETSYGVSRPWDGTDARGERVPAGTYTVVMVKRDSYGNRQLARRTLVVSDVPLVAQPWSVTVGADAGMLYRELRIGRDGWTTCPPKASSRVAGGITVISKPAASALYGRPCDDALAQFAVTLPFEMNVMDQVSITATGSAHPAGSSEGIRLSARPGNADATSAPGVPRTTVGPYSPLGGWWFDQDRDEVGWVVGSDNLSTTEYDVASFDVQVVRYVPRS